MAASARRKGPATGVVIPVLVVAVGVRVCCVVVMAQGSPLDVRRGHDVGGHDHAAPRGTIGAVETSVEVSALAINVVIPDDLRWRDTRREEEFELQSLTIRMLPDGSLAAKAYGRPVSGGRGAYVSFPVPERPELSALVAAAADEAARRWAAHT